MIAKVIGYGTLLIIAAMSFLFVSSILHLL